MTSSARDRATDAVAGEVPAPAGDAPPLWWSRMFGPIEESSDRHGDKYVGFSRQSFTWVGLAELPADAVPLVPAGGSAPADEPEYLADVERNAVALAAEMGRMRPVVQAAEKWADVGRALGSGHALAAAVDVYRAGGSAPHQGATTDVTELLRRCDEQDQRRVLDDRAPSLTTDEVRALLGAATTTAPEA